MKNEDKKFIVYKSSAGSGKTYTLVKDYLRIVIKDPDKYRHVLAITFTNKAANEMKERVVGYLGELAGVHLESSTLKYLLPALENETELDRETIRKRAAKVLALILHNYSEFAISTIDSFVHRVVRTFAHDLHIPLNFEVEMDEEAFLEQAIDLLIDTIGTDEQLSKVMVEFVRKKADDELNWNIDQDLLQMSRVLLKEEAIPYLDQLRDLTVQDFIKIRQTLSSFTNSFEKGLIDEANHALRHVKDKGIPEAAFFQGDKGIIGFFKNIVQWRTDKFDPSSFTLQTIENNQWYKKNTDPSIAKQIDRLIPELKGVYQSIIDKLASEGKKYFTYLLIERKIFPLAVLNEIERVLNELKEENNLVLISEFNRRINAIIRSEPVPFIYERLGEKYQHYLLDEFQDTSVMQWHNLLPLLENSLASAHFSMVVGDGKQAIYRFRAGEVEQLESLPKILNKEDDPALELREQVLARNYSPRILAENFRSNAGIVEFNNRFFRHISGYLPEEYRLIYADVVQQIKRKEKTGMTRLDFIKPDQDSLPYQELTYLKIQEIISELLADGFNLSDIAILCRKNKEAGRIAAFLLQQGIAVISSESLLLSQSMVVNFIIAWIRLLLNPADDIAKSAILNFLLQTGQILGTALNELLNRLKPSPGTESKEDPRISSLNGFASFLRTVGIEVNPAKLLGLDLYQLVEELIRGFYLNKKTDPYLQFFQDAVLDFVYKKNVHLQDFVKWWDEHSDNLSIIVPEGINAVRILTIHKAKGLEFPVVIYPYADTPSISRESARNDLWVHLNDKDLPELKTMCLPFIKQMKKTSFSKVYSKEEDKCMVDLMNLLYVVMTRPIERLYVMMRYPPKNLDDPDSIPKIVGRFLRENELWEDEKSSYLFGMIEKHISAPVKPEKEQVHYREFATHDWSQGVFLRFHAPEVWDMENPEKNKTWGNLVHLVLSQIRYPDDIDKVLTSFLNEGILDEQSERLLRYKINQILAEPDISAFFLKETEVKAEAEIISHEGSLYRPDRLVFKGRQVSILDYKTGKSDEKHISQVRQYASLLSQLEYDVKGAYLVYLEEKPSLVKVNL